MVEFEGDDIISGHFHNFVIYNRQLAPNQTADEECKIFMFWSILVSHHEK